MARPITMITGQWADMKLEQLAPLAKKMGYDGLEIQLTQNHIDFNKADDEAYLKERWDILASNGLNCYALSNHLTKSMFAIRQFCQTNFGAMVIQKVFAHVQQKL